MKRLGALLIVFTLLCCAACACAETARINTGSGSLNMRRKADSKAAVVQRIPNRAQVEIEETGEVWSRISYKGKSGYVRTEFLVTVSEAEEEAAREMQEQQQEQLPNGGFAWITTEGGTLNIRRRADAESAVVGRVPNRALVDTLEVTRLWSRIAYRGEEGYVKTEYLKLPADMIGEDIFADDGYVFLRGFPDAGAMSVMVVRADQPMTIRDMDQEWIRVACYDDVRGEVVGYVSADDVSEHRQMPGERLSSPMHVKVSVSAAELTLGDLIDVKVDCDMQASYRYIVYRDGKKVVESVQTSQNVSGYRPRAAGRYRLEVVASDDQGRTIGCETFFTVKDDAAGTHHLTAEGDVYSQKDGWWLDKKYSKRNLDSSGCAIFTLSHALRQLGHTGDAITPQALAKTYPMYLAESGTVTGRLLAAAGRDFGFSTLEDKLKDEREIVSRFQSGGVFSFSVADGHIALAAGLSADGTKVRVLDSAPSATFERIKDAWLYVEDGQGGFRAVTSLWEIPGAKYYFETDQFGGLEYYMDLSYVAKRGVRPIQPKSR